MNDQWKELQHIYGIVVAFWIKSVFKMMFTAYTPLGSKHHNSIFIPNSIHFFHHIENFKMNIQKHSFLKQMCNLRTWGPFI